MLTQKTKSLRPRRTVLELIPIGITPLDRELDLLPGGNGLISDRSKLGCVV